MCRLLIVSFVRFSFRFHEPGRADRLRAKLEPNVGATTNAKALPLFFISIPASRGHEAAIVFMLVLPFIINTTSTWAAIPLCGRHLGNARSLFYFDRIAPHIPHRARRHTHAQPGELILGHRYRRGAAYFRSNTHTHTRTHTVESG